MTLELTATRLFSETRAAVDAGARYIVHQGSTRSSKTYTIVDFLIVEAMQRPYEIDIVRDSMPVLRRSAYKDFQDHLKTHRLYDENLHDKTNNVIHVGLSRFSFYGADSEAKLRGPERDVSWINEANEVSKDAFKQIDRRTRKYIILDYNPSHGSAHWIEELVLGSGREHVIHSTYLDNPFLPDAQVRSIEADVPVYREEDGSQVKDWDLTYAGEGVLIKGNPEDWAVFGLGERAKSERIIYRHWTEIDRMPDGLHDEVYGLDFGYSNPSALIRIGWKDVVGEDVNLIWDEVLYESKLTNEKLSSRMENAGVPKDATIYADSAQPDRIDALAKMGWRILPAIKGKGSVNAGIVAVKGYRLRITARSLNVKKEIESYEWQTDKDGNILDDPVKEDDHGLDAGRYATHTHKARRRASAGAYTTSRSDASKNMTSGLSKYL